MRGGNEKFRGDPKLVSGQPDYSVLTLRI